MGTIGLVNGVIDFIPTLNTVVWQGIIASAALSLYLDIFKNDYDRTVFKRVWQKVIDRILEPVGSTSAKNPLRPSQNR